MTTHAICVFHTDRARRALALLAALTGLFAMGAASAARAPLAGVVIERPAGAAKGVAILLADPGRTGNSAASTALAQGYAVATLDTAAYGAAMAAARADCRPLGDAVRRLGRDVAGLVGLGPDLPPLLIGEGRGAALAYALASAGDAGRFHAVVSLDFCPRELTARAACGAGDPPRARGPRAPWYVFKRSDDIRCPPAEAAAFVARVTGAHFTALAAGRPAAADPGFGALLQWLDPRLGPQTATGAGVGGLPLVETPAAHAGPVMAVFLSGDGGWAALDKGVSAALARRGISTVGWDSLSYFWREREPAAAADDLARLLEHYFSAWHATRAVLVGYSFGASVLPFLVTRLPPDLRRRIALVALLAPSARASFEFHLSQWLGAGDGVTRPVAPEVAQFAGTPVLCILGTADDESVCPPLAPPSRVLRVPGNHHFDDDYDGLAGHLVEMLGGGPAAAR